MNAVIEALDALGRALANHNHVWTERERRLYEKAVRSQKVGSPQSDEIGFDRTFTEGE